jgi:hypothetical protein
MMTSDSGTHVCVNNGFGGSDICGNPDVVSVVVANRHGYTNHTTAAASILSKNSCTRSLHFDLNNDIFSA